MGWSRTKKGRVLCLQVMNKPSTASLRLGSRGITKITAFTTPACPNTINLQPAAEESILPKSRMNNQVRLFLVGKAY